MSHQETQSIRHCSPLFARRQADSGKIRKIADLIQLNPAVVQTPRFKTDKLQIVGECLPLNPQMTWGAVVDLSNFFFLNGLHPRAG